MIQSQFNSFGMGAERRKNIKYKIIKLIIIGAIEHNTVNKILLLVAG